MIELLVKIFICYLLGSISGGVLIGKFKNVNIRGYGSGKTGAFNVARKIGIYYAIIVFIIDCGKGFIAVQYIGAFDLAFMNIDCSVMNRELISIGCGLSSIIGHIFPVFFGFRGGRGLATSAGVVFSIFPAGAISFMLIFSGGMIFTHYAYFSAFLASNNLLIVTYFWHKSGLISPFGVFVIFVYISCLYLFLFDPVRKQKFSELDIKKFAVDAYQYVLNFIKELQLKKKMEILRFRIKRVFYLHKIFFKFLITAPKMLGYRKLYGKEFYSQIKSKIKLSSFMYQLFAFYYVRYVLLSGLCELVAINEKNITKETYWSFGLLRDYMTLLDHIVDTSGVSLSEAMKDELCVKFEKIMSEFFIEKWVYRDDLILDAINETARLFSKNSKYYKTFYTLDEDRMLQVIETDTGAFSFLLGKLFSIFFDLNQSNTEIIENECFFFSMAFTVADDFLDLRDDLNDFSLNAVLYYAKHSTKEFSIITERINNKKRVTYKWMKKNTPETLNQSLSLFKKYYDQLTNKKLKSLVEITLQAGLKDYIRTYPFLFGK